MFPCRGLSAYRVEQLDQVSIAPCGECLLVVAHPEQHLQLAVGYEQVGQRLLTVFLAHIGPVDQPQYVQVQVYHPGAYRVAEELRQVLRQVGQPFQQVVGRLVDVKLLTSHYSLFT